MEIVKKKNCAIRPYLGERDHTDTTYLKVASHQEFPAYRKPAPQCKGLATYKLSTLHGIFSQARCF